MRKFFLDVDGRITNVSAIIGDNKLVVNKTSTTWDVEIFSKHGLNGDGSISWVLDESIELTDKELRALYHLLTAKSES